MKNIHKEYLNDVKKFFPFVGKNERNYLDGIMTQLDEFIESDKISSKYDLYEKYCQPYNIVKDYYDTVDTEVLIKRIRLVKRIKCLIIVLIFAILGFTSWYVFDKIETETERAKTSLSGSTTVITDGNEPDTDEGYTVYQHVEFDEDTP